jgi:RNA polymerase sigma-70 factor (ECF subfamily)
MHDAQDLTQGFFACLLEKERLATVTPEKGKFRSFLLASFNHFLADAHDRSQRLKRGGDREIISIDAQQAEDKYKLEPADQRTPENLFERQWAVALLDRVLERVRLELDAAGKARLFQELQTCLVGERDGPKQSEMAARLGMSESALAVTVHRLRQRYRQLLREELARTVGSREEIDEEMRHLFAVLRS